MGQELFVIELLESLFVLFYSLTHVHGRERREDVQQPLKCAWYLLLFSGLIRGFIAHPSGILHCCS